MLTQTLLEHHELHEKLADTINDVRNAPEPPSLSNDSSTADKNNTAAQDVEAAIKAIVQKATSDPFFDKLVKEVIGSLEVFVFVLSKILFFVIQERMRKVLVAISQLQDMSNIVILIISECVRVINVFFFIARLVVDVQPIAVRR